MSVKNEFYIYLKNKPKWVKGLSFDKQTRDVQQFYLWELKKIREGITVGGIKFHPWSYWHINHWHIFQDIEHEDGSTERVNSRPLLRDNEYFINENVLRADTKPKKGLLLFGTRRFSKSATIASWSAWNSQVKYGGEASINAIIGGNQEDLDSITSYIDHGLEYLHPMFKLNRISRDWGKGAVFGKKLKNNETEIFSKISVTNLNMGGKKSNQKTAGPTPVSWVCDEIGKFDFKKSWEAAKPSFDTGKGSWRISPWLLGCLTAGNKVWTKDGDLVNIEELKTSQGIIGFNEDTQSYSKENISHWQQGYEKDCLRITTNKGKVVECSDDHPILKRFRDKYKYVNKVKERVVKFVEAKDLSVGDQVCVIDEVPLFGKETIEDSRLIGQLIGDGCYTFNNTPVLSTCDEEVYNNIFENYNYSISKERFTKNHKKYYEIRIKDLTTKLRNLGIYGQSKNKKTLPNNTFRLDKKNLSELIGGFFDANGHVTIQDRSRGTIALSSAYKNLLDEVVLALLKFGIHGTINYNKGSDSGFGKREGFYVLTISDRNSVFKFYESISFSIKYKQEKLEKVYNTLKEYEKTGVRSSKPKCSNMQGLRTERIVSIEYVGSKEVYNLTANTTNTYLAGAIVTHNTSGNIETVADAMSIVNNPEIHNLLVMDWSLIERKNPNPTWTRKNWGIFVPGQMSLAVQKVKSNLSEYLEIDNEELKNISIEVTPWEEANKKLLTELEELRKKDITSYYNRRMFYPLDTDDCFLQDSYNPFPSSEALIHKSHLLETGDYGKNVELYRNSVSNIIEYNLSDKELPKFPHEGGNIDSPFILFEEPPEPEERGICQLYCGGLDHYKHDTSSGDSLGAFYIFKRRQNIFDLFQNSIVACYVARPNTMDKFNHNVELLMKLYGAEVLQENADISFQQYLMRRNEVDIWLMNGEKLAQKQINSRAFQNNKYGLTPNVKNLQYIFQLVVDYCWEILEEGEDENGIKITRYGITRIKDIMLLEEIIAYKKGQNHDRILAFGYALAWAQYLDDINVLPKRNKSNTDDFEKERKRLLNKYKSNSFYSNRRTGFYG